MADLRRRDGKGSHEQVGSTDHDDDTAGEQSDCGMQPNEDPQHSVATDSTEVSMNKALAGLSPRWRNWIIRGVFSVLMICTFSFLIWLGPLVLVSLVLAIQIKCFHEIITIGYIVYKSQNLPYFRTLSWYFLLTSNYFMYGETMMDRFGILLSRTEFSASPFFIYHRFISMCLYIGGFVAFVFSLVKKHYLKQFTLFGYTHVTLFLIVTQSHFIMNNIFNGLVWFLLSTTLIICNDIWAYIFGFFFGKTPLIKLSPKKTWEGFIGGAFATVIYGVLCAYVLTRFDYFVCPIDYSEEGVISMTCERSHVFLIAEYELPSSMKAVLSMVGLPFKTLKVYPFIFHSMVMATFASLIGPFGGFFASGFKRAFKIKDFGDSIPGHGGLMDRFDCQLLMGTFVYVYYITFLSAANPQKLLKMFLQLRQEEQVELFHILQSKMAEKSLL